ncbi:hypothetical protein HDV00_009586 [Rhizophlyctis rosea]|nr:hypothetical protein HDV00_009586 [Rhizophlyctis rosea]
MIGNGSLSKNGAATKRVAADLRPASKLLQTIDRWGSPPDTTTTCPSCAVPTSDEAFKSIREKLAGADLNPNYVDSQRNLIETLVPNDAPRSSDQLPKRLFDVLTLTNIKSSHLCNECRSTDSKYIIVSHVWGMGTTYPTSNWLGWDIYLDDETKIFRAINLALRNRIRYIWMDILCLPQGEGNQGLVLERYREMPKMGTYYQNAAACLAFLQNVRAGEAQLLYNWCLGRPGPVPMTEILGMMILKKTTVSERLAQQLHVWRTEGSGPEGTEVKKCINALTSLQGREVGVELTAAKARAAVAERRYTHEADTLYGLLGLFSWGELVKPEYGIPYKLQVVKFTEQAIRNRYYSLLHFTGPSAIETHARSWCPGSTAPYELAKHMTPFITEKVLDVIPSGLVIPNASTYRIETAQQVLIDLTSRIAVVNEMLARLCDKPVSGVQRCLLYTHALRTLSDRDRRSMFDAIKEHERGRDADAAYDDANSDVRQAWGDMKQLSERLLTETAWVCAIARSGHSGTGLMWLAQTIKHPDTDWYLVVFGEQKPLGAYCVDFGVRFPTGEIASFLVAEETSGRSGQFQGRRIGMGLGHMWHLNTREVDAVIV